MQEDQCWQAVLERDSRYDRTFVYAVRSTGIYCRPTCPSRRPGRPQVSFFGDTAQAERAGFRPCKRCRPTGVAPPDPVATACRIIDAAEEHAPTLGDLGAQIGISPFHLHRVFKRSLGITPRQYAETRRVDRLKAGLRQGVPVTAALYDAGYGSSSRLYEQAPARLGMTPRAYGQGAPGQRISFTVTPCPLGLLLVAVTERGICAVCLGDDPAALQAELRAEYPAAAIAEGGSELAEWVSSILRHLDGYLPSLELPLDLQATAFQWRIWDALRAIPYGETRSYSAVARAVGQPGAARAVAGACAANRVALLIPCHRVVREDGSAGGYRWGEERKRTLLGREQVRVAAAMSDSPAGTGDSMAEGR